MDTDIDRIKALGGATRVAELLGYGDGGVQRVHNWILRGIPSKVKVERPDLFMRPIDEIRRERAAEQPNV